MQISTTANCNANALHRAAGFTLVEILVVVVMVALFAAVLAPGFFLSDDRELDQAGVWLEELLATVGEQSVFSGELLGIHLTDQRITPMRFDPEQQKFVPFGGDSRAALESREFKETLRLSWELETVEQHQYDAPPGAGYGLVEAAEARLVAGEDRDDRERRPQLFFFPSGEATPARLKIELSGDHRNSAPLEITLNALGQAELLKEDEP
ncbi:prepilin-type N-terminal cleavage/methylation domain-containing protein [Alcanivorax quisquiliarum]|uniref:Prepilin-type N-terminal cleavage/methylation domain-containing protein n=1 Tax=Alcanivorax quisquiliarum TaxID=2933565 RepID=A0ABT0E3B7_9GAMM|nr:prepilin-type N-terminal cleavage/methylation domain-containing protein [Alcanivorax quisquiliarum]MCK0536318.1 prepilin-type N-terminal cleavage/methylation domain-containing protein [Alcanivorax quisquiliarum]